LSATNDLSDSEIFSRYVSADEMFSQLQPMISLQVRYSGEIPHRTMLDRLSHGRRPVFALMMIFSLVGAAFGYGRGMTNLLAPFILLIFIGGIAWTFYSFREEREWLLDRELTRLRETLSIEVRRRFDEVLREFSSRITRWLRDQLKRVQRDTDDFVRKQSASAGDLNDRRRTMIASQLVESQRKLTELRLLQDQLSSS
jgi:hypothetical protein